VSTVFLLGREPEELQSDSTSNTEPETYHEMAACPEPAELDRGWLAFFREAQRLAELARVRRAARPSEESVSSSEKRTGTGFSERSCDDASANVHYTDR